MMGRRHRLRAVGAGGREVLGEALRVDGRGGDDDLEVRALGQDAAQVTEQEVDVQAALVGLVDDDRVVLLEQLVALDLGQQDAVGHHLDLGVARGFAGEPHVEADLVADGRAQFLGDALGHGARGKAARLGVADHALFAQAELEQHLGQLGGLARSGLAGHDDHLVVLDRRHDVFTTCGNGQCFGIGNRQSHGLSSLGQPRDPPRSGAPPAPAPTENAARTARGLRFSCSSGAKSWRNSRVSV